MSEREDYPTGAPCWVDALRADPEGSVAFYSGLFDWEATDRSGPSSAPYYVCTSRNRDVAAIGSRATESQSQDWNTYVRVESVDATRTTVEAAGGSVVQGSHDSHDGGRRAFLADPAGATFGIWQPGSGHGAQLVNEPSAWAMSILNTHDAPDAIRFYGAVFGWTTSTFDAGGFDMTMWHLPGYFGGESSQPVPRDVVAVMGPLAADASAHWGVNFWVHDANLVAARAEELGGSVVTAPTDSPPFREAVVADPVGAAVAISQLLTTD